MCGVTGYLNFSNFQADPNIVRRMADRIAHRGPDDVGIWAQGPIAFGHRRLSIVDLSPAGHQPMHSVCGRYVLVFNGEIYNHNLLRQDIEAESYFDEIIRQWRGHSDTEVILAALGLWGLSKTLTRLVGMFAIALWDRKDRTLFLARDRLGEKPIYYGRIGDTFMFGSELKSLRAHPDFCAEVDRGALSLLMRHNYIPAPYSIYKYIKKLLPGTCLQVAPSGEIKERNYWSLPDIVNCNESNSFAGTDEEAIEELERLMSNAIKGQMISDVPLGAFLSGGIDSSTVVALMQAQSDHPVNTFSIGFFEKEYDEAHHAKLVAKHLKTNHTELYVTAKQAQEVIPLLPKIYDEPFADSSQIPTFLVSQLAKKHVSVSLSGDGGDELFGGYNRYFIAGDMWRHINRMHPIMRNLMEYGIRSLTPETWTKLSRIGMPILPSRYRQNNVGDKLYKLASILSTGGQDVIYHQLISHWQDPATLVLGGFEPPTPLKSLNKLAKNDNFIERMMLLDTISYLPDDILVKVDRAAMGVSLETRVPMLDHRIVEFAWSLPFNMKVRNGESKWLLRQVLSRHVPKKIMQRPKMGFGVPIGHWLRGPLREWAEELLDPIRIKSEGYFNPLLVEEKWRQHLSGRHNWQYLIWDVLMFQAWLENESSI